MTLSRRSFLGTTAAATGLSALPGSASRAQAAQKPGYKLGMVTYNMGKDMDIPALIDLCHKTGLEGVELRTTHAHGVEVELSKSERADVKKQFADGGIEIAGLGSAFEYHSQDSDEVKRNIEGTKVFAQLAADVGAPGIKIRPNGVHKDEEIEVTCKRIGEAWREVAAFAGDLGVQARMEVHGRVTSLPKNIRKMLDYADHPNALVCWNSNRTDMDRDKSIAESFELLKDSIALVHITDIGVYQYPWQDLFDRLTAHGYTGYCLAEIQYNDDPERFMKYYRTLFDLYTGGYQFPQEDA